MKSRSQVTVVALSAAIDLAANVVQKVSDEQYTDQLQGSVVSRAALDQMIAASINRRLSRQIIPASTAE